MLKFTIRLKLTFSLNKKKKRGSLTDIKPRQGFLLFIDRETERLSKQRKPSTCSNYMTARRSLATFLGGEDIAIERVSPTLIEKYSSWLSARGVCSNTISCYMRSLRFMYNTAVKRKRTRQQNPFRNVFTGNEKTRKRALTKDEMRRIEGIKPADGTFTSLARDIFMFSFYAMGMPFTDIAALKKSQISNGVITYRRQKTGQEVKVGIEPCMTRIMKRHCREDSEYVFPLHKGLQGTPHRAYEKLLNRYNRALNAVAEQAGIHGKLTSYVARHTWASMAYHSNVPLNVISQAMGHATPRTTLIYIKELDNRIVMKANRKILNKINGETSVQEL